MLFYNCFYLRSIFGNVNELTQKVSRMQKILTSFSLLLLVSSISAQDLEPFALTDEWLSKIEKLAPSEAKIKINGKKKILIFSLHTGFEHWVIPHTEAVMKLLAEKSGAFEVAISKDIAVFEKRNLKKYDAIVLNNNCSIGDKRDIFWDVLKEDPTLTEAQKLKEAKRLENNLLNYVEKGNGLFILHGGIVMQNKSEAYGEMVGGSFDYHPKQQLIQVELAEPDHPLVEAFEGNGFVHVDEPYFFNNAYFNYNFRPLLYMEADKIIGKKTEVRDNIKYISWIKSYGKGRIFYSSASHNAQSFENPKLLRYFLDGLQYTVGDLQCADIPIK